ncbi:zinc-dependent dehydrogenase [Chloroflexota bacterium]
MVDIKESMRVAMWYSNRDVRLEEMPVPEIGPDELLLKIVASGLCGSDVMEWYRLDRAPLVLGHEIGGEVVKVGEKVKRFKVGDRVTAAHHVPCNTCKYCLNGNHTMCDTLRSTNFDPGGLAEYVRLPAINVDRGTFLLPAEMTYEEATFIEPVACVLRGLKRTRIQPGNSVLIIGSGITGLLYLQLARKLGAGKIFTTDINNFRLEMARKLGADAVLDAGTVIPAKIKALNDGFLADIVVICTGALPAIEQGLNSVERDGTVIFFAPTGPDVTFPLSINDIFWRNDVTLTTSYAGSPSDHRAAIEMIRSGAVDTETMITHRFPLGETGKGFQLVAGAVDSVKVIIEPQK